MSFADSAMCFKTLRYGADRRLCLTHNATFFLGIDDPCGGLWVRHITSDPREKDNVEQLDLTEAARVVRAIPPHRYTIDGEPAAGLMADAVPEEYTHTNTDGMKTVDYNSMFTHLWACVQHLQDRVDVLSQNALSLSLFLNVSVF